jgi:flagellar motor switch protein FliG
MDPRRLPGPLKAAILIKSLGSPAADEILATFTAKERSVVERSLSTIEEVPAELIESVVNEFNEQLHTRRPSLPMRSAVEDAAGAGGQEKDGVRGLENLKAIESLKPEQVSEMLKSEHPQTLAVILSHVNAEMASEILVNLPDEMRIDVALRIAGTERFIATMVEEVDRVLGEIVKEKEGGEIKEVAGIERLAEILNLMKGETGTLLISEIEKTSPELAAQIRQRMFIFDDLVLIDDKGMQKVLRRVESKELAMALKAASEGVKAKIFKNMSQRAGELVKEEMEALGAVRMKDVEQAQQTITKIIQELEEKGEVVISGRKGEKFVG